MPGILGGNTPDGKAAAKTDGAYRTWGGVAPEETLVMQVTTDEPTYIRQASISL
jgi:hypothetical protein